MYILASVSYFSYFSASIVYITWIYYSERSIFHLLFSEHTSVFLHTAFSFQATLSFSRSFFFFASSSSLSLSSLSSLTAQHITYLLALWTHHSWRLCSRHGAIWMPCCSQKISLTLIFSSTCSSSHLFVLISLLSFTLIIFHSIIFAHSIFFHAQRYNYFAHTASAVDFTFIAVDFSKRNRFHFYISWPFCSFSLNSWTNPSRWTSINKG